MSDNLKEREAFEAWAWDYHEQIPTWTGTRYHGDVWEDLWLAFGAASRTMAQPPANRAQELHEKASMPWDQAEKLALEEAGICDAEIDELIGEASNTVLIDLLDKEDVRQFVRSILVHQPSAASATQQVAQPIEADRVSRDVPADARRVIELCQKALAEELSAWDIEPPLRHVKEAHDACFAWLAAPQTQADGMQPIDVLTSVWNAMQNSADGDDLLSKLEHMRGSIERSLSLAASPQPQPEQAQPS